MKPTFDVFDPRDGIPILTTRYEWVARLVSYLIGVDYGESGQGWVD